MVSIYACTDKLMLKQMLGADAVGHYSLASTVSVSWAFILSAIIDSLYPEIVQSFQKDRLRYERKNRQLYAIVFYVSLFVSAMICLVAKPFILILYGETYLPAVGPLRIVVWYTAFSYLGVARNAWMVCENRQKYLKYLYVSAAALNVVLNLALIPSWGASGAAAASLITQASTTILLPALIRPLRPNTRLMYRICGGDYAGKISLLMDHTARPGNVADPWYTEDFGATWQDVLEGCQGLLKEFMTERGDSVSYTHLTLPTTPYV